MRECIVGIDLGTSSVKLIAIDNEGKKEKFREKYDDVSPISWRRSVLKVLSCLNNCKIKAIGLSSQVGTYIIDDKFVINWNEDIGKAQLDKLKSEFTKEEFETEISMPHPSIISYPIPRLMYIKEHFPNAKKICMPKDCLCEMLVGKCVTDKYSWRGLANLKSGQYSRKFLNYIGINESVLPNIREFDTVCGYTKEINFENYHLQSGIPVYIGLNDFFASLLGMGVQKEGDAFDITGTSEHIGIIEDRLNLQTDMVSGPYIHGFAHYGVTASSGASLDFGIKNFGLDFDAEINLKNNPPIFLPYVNGERAPIWDSDARGVFFGIGSNCSKSDMMYSVAEGVVFSLYHIYESISPDCVKRIITSGGASENRKINILKAELFNTSVVTLNECDTSALGAYIIASVGIGKFKNFSDATEKLCTPKEIFKSEKIFGKILSDRYEIYKSLYSNIKEQYKAFRRISQ